MRVATRRVGGALHRAFSSVPAAVLATATAERKLLDLSQGGLPRLEAISSLDAAYQVQSEVIDAVVKSHGATLVGWKIGATNAAAQKRMGLQSPFYGPVFAHNLRLAPASVSMAGEGFRVRGVEAEYAFLMGDDLPAAGQQQPQGSYSREEVGQAVAAVYPVVEVCGSRFTDAPPATSVGAGGTPLATLLSVADQASHGCLVRGVRLMKPKAAWDALLAAAAGPPKGGFAQLPVRLFINGKQVAAGHGGDVLGDPLVALTWLANALAAAGRPLRAGDIVTSGTMTGLAPVAADDEVVAEFAGFGTVQVTVAA